MLDGVVRNLLNSLNLPPRKLTPHFMLKIVLKMECISQNRKIESTNISEQNHLYCWQTAYWCFFI